jgi:hypothetical protein
MRSKQWGYNNARGEIGKLVRSALEMLMIVEAPWYACVGTVGERRILYKTTRKATVDNREL